MFARQQRKLTKKDKQRVLYIELEFSVKNATARLHACRRQ
jgi:hypothetical protein